MYKFGSKSKRNLATCHPDLQKVCNEVIKHFDISVLEGHRTAEAKMKYFEEGKSKLDGVTKRSKHQAAPSLAVDIVPYPVDWKDDNRFYYMAGLVMGVAKSMDIDLIWCS